MMRRSVSAPQPSACILLAILCAGPAGAQSYRPAVTPAPGDTGAAVVIERHANGQLAKRYTTRNGQAHGLWQEWDSTGRVLMTLDWRDGKGEGVFTYFHPNGAVRPREWVTDDVYHGLSESWHDNGQKASDGTFVRGVKANPFRYWAEDGTPRGPWTELLTPSADPMRVLSEGWPVGFNVWDPSFTPDLETLFVGTGDDAGGNRRIVMRRWRSDGWQPVALAPFADTTAAEGSPMVSPDGEWVYFSSDRHAAREPRNRRRDLYRASRSSGWKTVERVTNTPLYGEVTLSLARNGTGVLWTDRREGRATTGLYEVRLRNGRAGAAPTLTIVSDLSNLHRNETSGEAYPVMAPDGSFILFSNYDIDGTRSKEDMFITRRTASVCTASRSIRCCHLGECRRADHFSALARGRAQRSTARRTRARVDRGWADGWQSFHELPNPRTVTRMHDENPDAALADYHELCAYTLTHGDAAFVHQHVVDAWAAQHATPTSKPIGVFFALMGLYLHVEHGWTGRAVQLAHMQLAKRLEPWPIDPLPVARGEMSATDVLAFEPGPARDAAITQWAAAVWAPYSGSRDGIEALLRRRGVL